MKKKLKSHFLIKKLSKIPRIYWLGLALITILAALLIISSLSNDNNSKKGGDESGESKATAGDTNGTTQEVEAGDTNQQNSSSNKNSGTNTQTVPFKISKVYFSKAPEPPRGASFGQCSVGQEIVYTAVADVTATAPGTMTYNWKTADQLGGISKSYDQETYTFSAAGKVSISKNLAYVARENAGYEGNLWNRQYINLFVSSPNENYANIENPGAANGVGTYGFVWGMYIDLC